MKILEQYNKAHTQTLLLVSKTGLVYKKAVEIMFVCGKITNKERDYLLEEYDKALIKYKQKKEN